MENKISHMRKRAGGTRARAQAEDAAGGGRRSRRLFNKLILHRKQVER